MKIIYETKECSYPTLSKVVIMVANQQNNLAN